MRMKPWKVRVQPPNRGGRAGRSWYTSDQRLLAEIRDLLVEVELNTRRASAVPVGLEDLGFKIDALRRQLAETVGDSAEQRTAVATDLLERAGVA